MLAERGRWSPSLCRQSELIATLPSSPYYAGQVVFPPLFEERGRPGEADRGELGKALRWTVRADGQFAPWFTLRYASQVEALYRCESVPFRKSYSILSNLLRLHVAQSSSKLDSVVAPPLDTGMIWSYCISLSLPHRTHRPLSLFHIVFLKSLGML